MVIATLSVVMGIIRLLNSTVLNAGGAAIGGASWEALHNDWEEQPSHLQLRDLLPEVGSLITAFA